MKKPALLALAVGLAFFCPAEAGRFVKGIRLGSGQAAITWLAPERDGDNFPLTDGADYEVCYGTTSLGPYSTCVTVGSFATLSYTTPADLGSGTWYFIVRTIDSGGNKSNDSYEYSKVIP